MLKGVRYRRLQFLNHVKDSKVVKYFRLDTNPTFTLIIKNSFAFY